MKYTDRVKTFTDAEIAEGIETAKRWIKMSGNPEFVRMIRRDAKVLLREQHARTGAERYEDGYHSHEQPLCFVCGDAHGPWKPTGDHCEHGVQTFRCVNSPCGG